MYHLSYFQCDVTPPLGHPMCGGWITPAAEIVDPQTAHGIILFGDDAPIVLVTVDWCEIRNGGYDQWRNALADAVGTTADRVSVHTVHQHDAAFADPDGERILQKNGMGNHSLDIAFFDRTIANVAEAARAAMATKNLITHISTGQARIEKVASNRRVMKDANGKVGEMRGSSCKVEAMRDAPEGLIDPFLKTIAFWNGDTMLAAMHYYATHPMSHYGKGGVSCDFCGLARNQLAEETGVPQIYFTGGAGNIAAGKYNDGSPAMRPILKDRMLNGMRQSLAASKREPLEHLDWKSMPVHLHVKPDQPMAFYENLSNDRSQRQSVQITSTMGITFLDRLKKNPDAVRVSCLKLNSTAIVLFPGEPFVEYQLFAQQSDDKRFVAFTGYGDCGMGYIPIDVAYEEGGYESSAMASFVGPGTEGVLKEVIIDLMDDH